MNLDTDVYYHDKPFKLESGDVLPQFQLAYQTFGKLNEAKDNVIWVCHALTANADVSDWWAGLFGANNLLDPTQHFIVCANVLGSCYGSTHALSVSPHTQEAYYHDFPMVTIRDMVKALDLLRASLGIKRIHLCMGGSMGGQQAMEWAILQPDVFESLVLLATNAYHSAWGIAFNETQRMAIQADQTWSQNTPKAGLEGLRVARAIALLSYRNYATYKATQQETSVEEKVAFKASSYQQYQGEKLMKRFNAFSYWTLSKAMDAHQVGRGRGSVEQALQQIKAKTLVIGISSDVLFPTTEQQYLATSIPEACYEEIDSLYGHDGFLIENDKIKVIVQQWQQEKALLV